MNIHIPFGALLLAGRDDVEVECKDQDGRTPLMWGGSSWVTRSSQISHREND